MAENVKEFLIGHVGVDSGQLMICDPCYIDSEWENEDFEDVRIYKNEVTSKILTYGKDFIKYDDEIPEYGKTMNDLIEEGNWVITGRPAPKSGFSYNACAQASLSEDGHGELSFKMGHAGAGIAFSTAYGDGLYPVYAHYDEAGIILSVTVKLQFDE